ncbi:MAG: DinB family protein [Acidobacteria bacterium]|nr:DinB family protein [Acidobacteriota bacterium]
MKKTLCVSFFILAVSAPGRAQTANPLTAVITERFNGIRLNLEESAELMPEEKYSFRLTEPQRTFGEWIAHTAMGNYSICAEIKGEKAPEAAQHAHDLKTKTEISQALKESFAYCAEVLKGMNDQKALAPAGPNHVPPVRAMVLLVSADNEHYGNLVGYLRASNLVPPSTTRAEREKKAKAAGPAH